MMWLLTIWMWISSPEFWLVVGIGLLLEVVLVVCSFHNDKDK